MKGGTDSGEGLIIVGDDKWTDYIIEMKIKSPEAPVIFGFVARVTAPDQFYSMSLVSQPGRKDITGNRNAGGWTRLAQVDMPVEEGTWYVERVTCEGKHFEIWVDDKKFLEFDDSTYWRGRVGLRVWSDVVEIDYFKVDNPRVFKSKPSKKGGKKKMNQIEAKASIPDWLVYPEEEWQTITPGEAGISDVESWNQWVKATEKSAHGAAFQGEDHSGVQWGVVITRGGYLLQTFGNPDYKYQTASLGKCFTMACLQLAIDEGLIASADDLIKKYWTGEGQLNSPHKYLNQGHIFCSLRFNVNY